MSLWEDTKLEMAVHSQAKNILITHSWRDGFSEEEELWIHHPKAPLANVIILRGAWEDFPTMANQVC